jgi:hypothetical protein
VAITDWPQMDQLSNNIADDMNAEKLPIVPTTSFTKPSVLVPVRHSAGRPHTGRLAKRCDALVPEGLRLAPDRGDTSAGHCDPVRVAGDHPGGRSCVPNLSVTVGSEPRSDAIGIRRTRLGSLHPPPRGEHPRPTNGHPDGCRWLSAGSDHLLPGRGPSAYTRHQLASDRPEREE